MINMYLLEGDKDVSVMIKDTERTKSLIKLTFPYYNPTEILNLCRIYNVGVVYTLDRMHEISRRIKSAGYRVVSINDISGVKFTPYTLSVYKRGEGIVHMMPNYSILNVMMSMVEEGLMYPSTVETRADIAIEALRSAYYNRPDLMEIRKHYIEIFEQIKQEAANAKRE